MNRKIITISDNGTVTIPSETRMSISEIAELFEIYYQIAKKHIRTLGKLSVANGDYSGNCVCDGSTIDPDYYDLEMVIALAFRIESGNAQIFRSANNPSDTHMLT